VEPTRNAEDKRVPLVSSDVVMRRETQAWITSIGAIASTLLPADFTGNVTLHVHRGSVGNIEVSEKHLVEVVSVAQRVKEVKRI
jgi:hypothetical protein